MALEDTDNLDNNQESNGNGDEQSNRTFRLLMLGMGGLFVLGLIVIAVIFLTQQGGRAQIAAQNAAIQATNTAQDQLVAIQATDVANQATNTAIQATNTVVARLAATATLPPTAVPTKPAPTVVPTVAPTSISAGNTTEGTPAAPSTGSAGATSEPTKASGAASGTTGTKLAATAAGSAVKPASTASGSTAGASGGITSTKNTTSTVAGGDTQVPKTGAGDSLGLVALAAGLVAVFFVARRLRTTQA
jgi:hypothetical protein